ncbi:MAG: 7-cyano-7-deazaguanine synthase QueC [bacterium]
MKKAVVLLSGGLDSATALAVAINAGYAVYCLSCSYGQRHVQELKAASNIAIHYKAFDHKVISFDLGNWGGSALTDAQLKIPKGTLSPEIPITYVPARNMIFLSFALSYAEVLHAEAIFIGVNALDYSGYPDCRPEFIAAFQEASRLGTKCGVEASNVINIKTPLIGLKKSDIILLAKQLDVPLHLTRSCYDDGIKPCGSCDSCLLRAQGFREASLDDPAL